MLLRKVGIALVTFTSAVAGLATVSLPAVATTPPGPPAARSTVYAAPDGHGTACVSAAPCSIIQAQHTVRALTAAESATAPRDIVVSLADGTYALDAPLTFTAQDSGVAGHPVRWEAAPGAHPVFSGGVPIKGWQQSKTDTSLWSAPVPADLTTRQLYANGVRVPRASGKVSEAFTQTPTGFTASDAMMATWRNPQNIEFIFTGGHGAWTQVSCPVATINGTAITMRQTCWDNMKLPSNPQDPFGDNPSGGFPSLPSDAVPTEIQNAFELLHSGQWYLDQTAHVLYYRAKSGDNVHSMNFIAPKLEQLVNTATTADAPLHDMTFRGVDFSYATWLQPSSNDGFVEMQANFTLTGPGASNSEGLCQYSQPAGTCPFAGWTRPSAAVDLTGTKNVSFLGNTFEHLGGAGLGLQHGIAGDLIQGNAVTDVSGVGILFGAVDDPQPLGGDQNEIATNNTIDDNYVHNIGVEYPGAPAIFGGYSRGTHITHNEIGDVPYSGISFGWGGWHTNSVSPNENPNINADNTIANNVIYHDMSVLGDGGGIYTNGPQGTSYEHGMTISGNVNFAGPHTSFMIYDDEGSDYLTITGNAQYAEGGNFNGGCSTTGHMRRQDNYRVGDMNMFPCPPSPVDVEDLGGNKVISPNPLPGDIPSAVLTGAGLLPQFATLSTQNVPEVAAVSPGFTGSLLISGSGFTKDAKVNVGGKDVSPADVNVLSPNYLVVTGSMGGAVSVTTTAGTSAASSDGTASMSTSLSTSFSNVGITDDGNTAPGNIDGSNYSFSAEALAAQRLTPGGRFASNGVTFTWPTASNGSADNALAVGQTVGLYGSSSTLGFLVTSTYAASGTGTIYYTDGTTQSYTLGSPNWTGAPPSGSTPAVSMPYRNGPSGPDATPVHIYFVGVPLDATKTVQIVRLPNIGSGVGVGVPALHVFAMALAGDPDVALGKPATQSTTAFGGDAGRAVDGDSNGSWFNNSVSHTDFGANAWWQVDLGSAQTLSRINVWNRTDCCSDRLTDFWIFVSNGPFDPSLTPAQQAAQPGVWSSHQTGAAANVTTVAPGVSGRYVMVQLNGSNYLALAEVEAFTK
jgi:hypothetical protein